MSGKIDLYSWQKGEEVDDLVAEVVDDKYVWLYKKGTDPHKWPNEVTIINFDLEAASDFVNFLFRKEKGKHTAR